jgi:DNA-binding protein HU-beta
VSHALTPKISRSRKIWLDSDAPLVALIRRYRLGKKSVEAFEKTSEGRRRAMTKSQLVQKLSEESELSKKQADTVLQALVELTVGSVRKGDPVKIPGLGTFRKVQTKARMGRNPQTGEPIKIPARKKVRFSVAKTFKESVLGKK